MIKIVRLCDGYDFLVLVLNAWLSWLRIPPKKLASVLGSLTYAVRWKSPRTLARRISRDLPGKFSPSEMTKLTKDILRYRWEERLSYAARRRIASSFFFRVEGLRHLESALSQGRGVILWDSPLGKKLLAKVALAERGFTLWQVHGPQHGGSLSVVGQTLIRRMHRGLERNCLDIIEIQDDSMAYLRQLVRRLNQNGIICIAGFGNLGQKFVQVEFMGVRKRFATGQVNLARMTNSSIIPMFCYQDENNHEVLVLESPINLERGENWDETIVTIMTEYARLMESYAHKYPSQWHWVSSFW